MRFSIIAALIGSALAMPSAVDPRDDNGFTLARGGDKVIVTEDNTLNGTKHHGDNTVSPMASPKAISGNLPLHFKNNYDGGQVYAYIQGKDSDGAVVFVGPSGNLIYPSSGGSAVPVPVDQDIAIPLTGKGGVKDITLPITMTSGRVYFSDGKLQFYMVSTAIGDGVVQPAAQNINGSNGAKLWGFIELTYTDKKAVYANISYVDFVGMLMAMELKSTDGNTQTTKALDQGSIPKVCSELQQATNKDGWPWAGECITNGSGEIIRILSPGKYQSIDGNHKTAFNGYWSDYVNKVWDHYSSNTLTINTGNPNYGKVECRVSGGVLKCGGGDNKSYPKPTDDDIWGCNSGTFDKAGANALHLLVIPILCAAFVRSELLLPGGNIEPSLPDSKFYTVEPTHHYAKAIHNHEVDHKGYTFSYDDVHPPGGIDSSGLLSTGNPESMTIFVGGY